MLIALLLSSIAASSAVQRFHAEFPAAHRIASLDGQRLVHASGFALSTASRIPEVAARAFLSVHGAAFGVTDRQTLVIEGAPTAGEPGVVRFRRTIDGLPVFGGNLNVGVDAQGGVFLVNGADVPHDISGRHALGESASLRAAFAGFPAAVQGAGPAIAVAGWGMFGRAVRAVYRVDFVAREPAGDWRVFVDAETGRTLFRENRRRFATAHGTVFEVSPVETSAALCALSGPGHSFCAVPVGVTFPNLVDGTNLTGTQTTVYNCKGADAPATAAGIPGGCTAVTPATTGFDFPVDSSFVAVGDDFAAAMAYFHLDKHITFFKGLDPTLPPAGGGKALRASVPALVNVQQGGSPFENAFYSPGLDAMVFGQGAHADFVYDSTVAYHEFTHGVVAAWGDFGLAIDSSGGVSESGAVNEGTADTMAAAETGRSQIGDFIVAADPAPGPFLRQMDDPAASRSCQGNGTVVTQFGTSSINGLDGEVHDDGEIWNGLSWEVFSGLKAAGYKACNGACEAGPALQYKALQLAGGTAPTLKSYWLTYESAASVLFPSNREVGAYIDCVGKRRGFDKCDRTVPVYAGERKVQLLELRYSHFQTALTATGPSSTFTVCSAKGTATTVHLRRGLPVELLTLDSTTLDATFAEDLAVVGVPLCSAGPKPLALATAGTWYVLFDSPTALVGGTPGSDFYLVTAGPGIATRPAANAPAVCAIPAPLAISLPSATVAPRGSLALSAGGGSRSGYTWSIATNASGGTINATTGVYTAGTTGSVTDVIKLSDSLGDTATTNISVSAAPPPGGGGCTTSGGPETLAGLLGLAAMLLRRRSGLR